MNKKAYGFTIVELLVVIVVIAILAAISIVAYTGVQQRARNAARLAAANQAQKILRSVLVFKSPSQVQATFNTSDGWSRACIGTGYPNIGGSSAGDCAWYGGTPYVSESATFNDMLKEVVTAPNMSGFPRTTSSDGDVVAGLYAASAWVDGKDMVIIEYSLEGEQQKCGNAPLVYHAGSNYTLTPTATPNYTVSGYGVTECAIAVVTDF